MSVALAAGLLTALAFLAGGAALSAVARDRALSRALGGGPEAPRNSPARLDRRLLRPLATLGGLGLGLLLAGPPGGVAGLVAGVVGPLALEGRRRRRRQERLEAQLGEAVATMAAGLRAGLSLSLAMAFAAREGEPPLSEALREVLDREALGMPLDASLEAWGGSAGSADVRLVVSVLQLHHRTGGDLPVVLDQVARTLRQRQAAMGEVRSLTAQARLSGAILGFLPVGFFLFLSAVSREDLAAAYRSPGGLAAILAGLALQGIAFLWIRSLLRVTR